MRNALVRLRPARGHWFCISFAALALLAAGCGSDDSTDGTPVAGGSAGMIGGGGAGTTGAAGTVATAGSGGRAAAGTTGGAGLGSSGSGGTGAMAGMTAGGAGGMSASGAGGATGGAGGATGGAGGRGGAGGAGGAGGGSASGATFTQVYSIIMMKCGGTGSNCHVTGNSGGLQMPNKATAYTNLVGVDSRECDGEKRVVAGMPADSLIVQAIEGTACVDRMPDGRAALSASEIMTFRSWIMAGAMNN